MAEKRIRIDMRLPESIMKKIEHYQEEEGIATRTATILELIRKGLDKRS
jgi:metal-responsive CopG/Arc/MetJ family transcriptional regulator